MKALYVTLLTIAAIGVEAGMTQAAGTGTKSPKGERKMRAEKPAPLAAVIEKVDGSTLTVMTRPMMGPDGLIPAKEKEVDISGAKVVIDGQEKTAADLKEKMPVRLAYSDDGSKVEQVESRSPMTPADRAAKKAEKAGGDNK